MQRMLVGSQSVDQDERDWHRGFFGTDTPMCVVIGGGVSDARVFIPASHPDQTVSWFHHESQVKFSQAVVTRRSRVSLLQPTRLLLPVSIVVKQPDGSLLGLVPSEYEAQ